MTLVVRFTRLNPTHHRFEAIRADGTRDQREFETRSILFHDLVHLAVESEARLRNGFYGTLAQGANYDAPRDGSEAQLVENVVGPLQGLLKNETAIDAEPFIARLKAHHESLGFAPATWLTPDFLRAVQERIRQLNGQWKATPFGQTMEVQFEA